MSIRTLISGHTGAEVHTTPSLTGKVFVTGGAGFLARGLYRRAEREGWNVQFTCYSRDDAKHAAMQKRYPNVRCIRGDIDNLDILVAAAAGHDLVLHFAAVKYVDRSEFNVWDTIRTNIEGSQKVVMAAAHAGAKMVAVSTDKACEPSGIYGQTKAVMERLVIDAVRMGLVDARVCRYGNVVASTGSLIPVLSSQLERTGRVQVTDPEMTRYWMSVDDAIDVILESLSERAGPGATVVPDPPAMRLLDTVHTVCSDMQLVDIIGLRAGERRHEKLVSEGEVARAYRVGGYTYIAPVTEDWSQRGEPAYALISSDPVRFIHAGEMQELILDASTV